MAATDRGVGLESLSVLEHRLSRGLLRQQDPIVPCQPGRLGGYAGNNKQSVAAATQARVFVGQPYKGTFSKQPMPSRRSS